MKFATLTFGILTALNITACNAPETTTQTAGTPDATATTGAATTDATAPSNVPKPSDTTMTNPPGTTGMTNTLNVTYECDQGGDLQVRYAGVADITTSTASLNVNGVELKLPRKGAVWDDGTYMLKGDDEDSLATADVFVYQHIVEKVNGVDIPSDKIIMKDCDVLKATP